MSQRRKIYIEAFKLQTVQLYSNGVTRSDLVRVYDLTPSTLGKWIK